jgi:hypothetical protein
VDDLSMMFSIHCRGRRGRYRAHSIIIVLC